MIARSINFDSNNTMYSSSKILYTALSTSGHKLTGENCQYSIYCTAFYSRRFYIICKDGVGVAEIADKWNHTVYTCPIVNLNTFTCGSSRIMCCLMGNCTLDVLWIINLENWKCGNPCLQHIVSIKYNLYLNVYSIKAVSLDLNNHKRYKTVQYFQNTPCNE